MRFRLFLDTAILRSVFAFSRATIWQRNLLFLQMAHPLFVFACAFFLRGARGAAARDAAWIFYLDYASFRVFYLYVLHDLAIFVRRPRRFAFFCGGR